MDTGRRDFLKHSLAATAGITAAGTAANAASMEERILLAQAANAPAPGDAVKDLPRGKIGDVEISRIICGGNLISGYAHSRDLIYVSDLLRHYFTDERVFQTFQLCEQNGINSAMLKLDSETIRILKAYWGAQGGKIQWIAQITDASNLLGEVDLALSNGAIGVFTTGQMGDELVKQGKTDQLAKTVSLIQDSGAIAGVSCHNLEVIHACESAGINPDFYMKTFHHHKYWSAQGRELNDNLYESDPDKTIDTMRQVKKPWVAFKVLAAGAIKAEDGFNYAVSNGADFICVGMFDFQVQQDAQLAKDVFNKHKDRARPWYA